MHYTLSYSNPEKHFIDIEAVIENITSDTIEIQLPAWRPGRYELAHFAKNMTRLTPEDIKGNLLPVQKLTKDRWKINTRNTKTVKISYSYYAQQMDAGGSWLDSQLLYVNFINCLVYTEGRQQESCTVHLQLPEQYQLACGLAQPEKHVLVAENYYQLVDSPLIASASLQQFTYEIDSVVFNIWVQGECHMDWKQVAADFSKFSRVQLQMMGGFPCKTYHFMFHWLPYQHYHGVEHHNSTVITLGPASQAISLYQEMLGISSHELFHTWNVIRIRPVELMPYDFTKENYFPTGFVAEGITTYYGDLFLLRAGVFSLEIYLLELTKTLNKHFMYSNVASLSLTESSFDLWLDGYTAGVPGRKASIYNKGALAALVLDLEIRRETGNASSLDDVMRYMWKNFGKREIGYSQKDYQQAVATVIGKVYDAYFEACIEGRAPLQEKLAEALQHIGCELDIRSTLPDSQNIEIAIRVKEQLSPVEKENLRLWANASIS